MLSLSKFHKENVFNPWSETDGVADVGEFASAIRRENLLAYFSSRTNVKYIFMAEALGYQGGHFSGIALTCERMFLGFHQIKKEQIFQNYLPKRTSDPKLLQGVEKEKGFNEPTDTVVWQALLENKINPFEVMLWNIFPFHPHLPNEMLTNRTPTGEELLIGYQYFQELKKIFPDAKIIAIGKKCELTLKKFNVECIAVPHPSMGGANKFREALKKL